MNILSNQTLILFIYLLVTRGTGSHSGESTVHRNPYETHNALDAIRTQDADLAVQNFRNFSIIKKEFQQF